MPVPEALAAEALYTVCDPSGFAFDTTDRLEEAVSFPRQRRARQALEFGISMRRDGYHLFAMGPNGVGKHRMVRKFLEQARTPQGSLSDWVYVQNFAEEFRPQALQLPPGMGVRLRDGMSQLVEDLATAVPAAFESDEYRSKVQEIERELGEREQEPFEELRQHASDRGVALLKTPAGLALAPVRDGAVLDPEAFGKLPKEDQEKITEDIQAFQERLQKILQEVPRLRREFLRRVKELNREFTKAVVTVLIEELKSEFAGLEKVQGYLDAVLEDVMENAAAFRSAQGEGEGSALLPGLVQASEEAVDGVFVRYQVNVIVSREEGAPAPILYQDHPTFPNLLGCVENEAEMGALVTDFTLIKPGSLHEADGGYLIVDARNLLLEPFAWEGLKRALRSGKIRIESPAKAYSLIQTRSLEPEAIPLRVKVILLGERTIYYLLHALDPEFRQLFKVMVDFDEEMARNEESTFFFAKLLAGVGREKGLLPFDRTAVARMVEHGSRVAGSARKISLNMETLVDLLEEADHWARQDGAGCVTRKHVVRALDEREERRGRLPLKMREPILEGTLLVRTEGEAVGQVNGLSVVEAGGVWVGQPHRITARTRQGSGKVLDIEREAKLGGPLHSKGVLILSSYLAATFVADLPLSLSASLVFEQSYGEVDGDSASSTELYALLSSLANAPVRQGLAVTGSVNQFGEVQAIGGVNEKIEGFFAICRERGLTGEQGVLIPASNVPDLMLHRDVVEAARAGRFRIIPVATIAEGIAVLTGQEAGERDEAGAFPGGSLFGRVEEKLHAYAERARRWRLQAGKGPEHRSGKEEA